MQNLRGLAHTWLRKSERIFKTDMVYLAKGGFWLGLGQVVGSIITFISAIAFANFVSQDTYGTYKYVLSVVSALLITALPGMGVSVTQAVARGFEGTVREAMKLRIRWGFLGSAASLLLSGYYLYQHNEMLASAFLICAFFVPFLDTFSVYGSLIHGRKLFKLSVYYETAAQIVAGLLLIGAVFFFDNLLVLLTVFLATWTGVRFALLKIAEKNLKPNSNVDDEALAYGKHLSIMKGFNTASGSLSSILLFQLIGSQSLAIYTFAMAPIEQMRGFLGVTDVLALPKLSDNSWKVADFGTLARKLLPFLAILSVGIGIYIVAAPFLFEFIFPQYLQSVSFSRILALSLLPTAINTFLTNVLRAKRETKKLHVINTTDIILTLAFTPAAVYTFGVVGLVYAIIAIKVTQTLIIGYLIFIQKPLPQNSNAGIGEENGMIENA